MGQADAGLFPKQVRAVVEIGTNYLFHLLAVARIGFDSEYADRYADTVNDGDITFLREHRGKLSFGAGEGGELVDVFLLPAAFGL